MTLTRAAMALAALLFATQALAAEKSVVKVDAATQKRIGVATARLTSARRSDALSGFARVLDPAPLAVLETDLEAAVAAASASAAEATRAQALYAADATVSAKAAEAAKAQARADASRVRLLRLRLGLEWGPAFQRMPDATRGRLVAALASGQAALVRIDVAGPTPLGVRGADIDLGQGSTVRAVVLGPARTSDPRLQSTGLIAQVSGPAAARLGTGLTAPVRLATGTGAVGVIVPRSALLRTGGQTVAYVRRDAASFERRVIVNGISQPDGLFVSAGFAPGEAVVTQGAQALFAAQNPPPAEE